MNRHTSNPFLAGWEEAESENQTTNVIGAFDMDATIDDSMNEGLSGKPDAGSNGTRRHSIGQADGNPFGAQRSADRRLYHRNMSSFEAASLQLEQQQQLMKENGASMNRELISNEQTELIAKMTADFQSAIQTNDKQFDTEVVDGFNPFDPFETIVDDDVSLPSPGKPTNQQQQITGRGANLNLSEEKRGTHESIDDNGDESVSNTMRNTKSDTQGDQFLLQKHQSQDQNDSISKATAEEEIIGVNPTTHTGNGDNSLTQPNNHQSTIKDIEEITSSSEPKSFFDPFETVVDPDALTSFANETSSNKSTTSNPGEAQPNADQMNSLGSSSGEGRDNEPIRSSLAGPIAESTSIETVIEKDSAKGQLSSSGGSGDQRDPISGDRLNSQATEDMTTKAIPRPTPINTGTRQAQIDSFSATPSRKQKVKAVKSQKKKASFQEDSSSSSDDDDRIQIVIKARNTSLNRPEGSDSVTSVPHIVPLLPPPPSKSSMKQARERGQVEDMPSPIMSYKTRQERQRNRKRTTTYRDGEESDDWTESDHDDEGTNKTDPKEPEVGSSTKVDDEDQNDDNDEDNGDDGQFVIPMVLGDSDGEDGYAKPETPLYDEDTSYVLEEFPAKCDVDGWEMMLRYPPKKKLTSNRFWKKIYVRIANVPIAPDNAKKKQQQAGSAVNEPQTCIALQIYDKPEDKKPLQEIPIQATYTVSEISSQQLDQFGKLFTIKLQYIFYKERVGVRQGQLARFIHTGHIGSSTTSGGHGVDPISIGAIKRMGAPIEHSPQISQIIKLGCSTYEDIKMFKNCLEDHLFKMPIHRDRALSTYKTEEVQMAVRDETYIELNQIGQIIKQLARVRLFFLSFLNGMPTVEVGVNDIHRQGREVVGRMDILPVVTEEWIRLESWELHPTIEVEEFEKPESRLIRLVPPDATFFEVMRFRVRPPRNRELPLQISANMTVTRTKVSINCEVMVPGEVSRKHGQIPCENIAIRIDIPECWIYFFREEKHFRMGSKKSVNRRPGKVKGIERFLGGGGLQDFNDDSSLIEVTSGQAKYEHHHHAIVWRAARWPKESQSAYVQNTMKIRLPLTAYDKMPENFYEYIHVEYTMPATTVSHTTLRSISVNPCDDEPPEKYVKYSSKYEYKVKMRLSVNISNKSMGEQSQQQSTGISPIIIMKQPDKEGDLQREEDSDVDDDDDDDEGDGNGDGSYNVGDHEE